MGPKLKRFLFRTAFAALSCCVLSAISFLAGRVDMANEIERSTLKLERDGAKAATVATTKNADHALTLEVGLLEDAKNTDNAVTRGKERIRALKPTVYEPAPKCGPTAYVIQPGALPDDVWRAYVAARNGVLYPEGDDSAGAGIHSPEGEGIVPVGATQPE